jgi:hypothetical protein
MAEFGGLKKNDQHLRDKILYKDFMCGKTDELTYAGETFTAKPIYKKKS